MSFHLYRVDEAAGRRAYTRLARVGLTGREGLIARFLLEQAAPDDDRLAWELSAPDLGRRAGSEGDGAEEELVLDLYPEGFTEVCLHRVERIVGVSEEDWTDAILVTRPLLTGAQDRTAEAVREHFEVTLPLEARESMEAFGIRGGYATGSFRWTRPKMNLGAAVCGRRGAIGPDRLNAPTRELAQLHGTGHR